MGNLKYAQILFIILNKTVKQDTAGQEKYRSIVKTYYRDSDCFICMYDITSEESFLNLRNWITSIRETAYNSKLKIVIIGNKLDLVREEIPRGVERRDAETLAKVISI